MPSASVSIPRGGRGRQRSCAGDSTAATRRSDHCPAPGKRSRHVTFGGGIRAAATPERLRTPCEGRWGYPRPKAGGGTARRAPMRRAAQPDDIAQAVAWLAQSDYLTGEILLSDGGLNLT
ncbi:SDR family oxidoreductase [Streptomyces sp. NPDC002172]